jgi:hypothetical protein
MSEVSVEELHKFVDECRRVSAIRWSRKPPDGLSKLRTRVRFPSPALALTLQMTLQVTLQVRDAFL